VHPLSAAVLTALITTAGAALVVHHQARRLRRVLAATRAAARLADAAHHRDLTALTARLHTTAGSHTAVTEAERIVDTAYARTTHEQEGGTP
jgi:hypothetical protein